MTFRFAIAIFFALNIYSLTKKIAIAKRLGIIGAGKLIITLYYVTAGLPVGGKVSGNKILSSRSGDAIAAQYKYATNPSCFGLIPSIENQTFSPIFAAYVLLFLAFFATAELSYLLIQHRFG